MRILKVALCDRCGDLTLVYRGSGGVVAADVAESGNTSVESVFDDMRTAVDAGNVHVSRGTCWVCLCDDPVRYSPEVVSGENDV